MRYRTIVNVGLFAVMLAGGVIAGACTATPAEGSSSGSSGKTGTNDEDATAKPNGSSSTGIPDGPLPPGSAPRAVPTAGTLRDFE